MLAIRVASTLLRTSSSRPTAVVSLARPAASSRLLSTTSPVSLATAKSLASSAGSGQGGKAEKEAARKEKERAKKEREQAKKEREKERLRKDKERAKLLKEREKAKTLKEKEKAQKEKDKAKALREKEKLKAEKKPRTSSVVRAPKAPGSAWNLYLTDVIAERKRELGTGERLPSLSEITKMAGQEYAQLAMHEKEELARRVEEQRAAYPAILEAWKKSLTPEMIKEENAVRATRRKLGLSNKRNLRVEGQPKRPITPYFLFMNEVREQGVDGEVLKGETNILQQSKLIAAAWRALSEDEKKRYQDRHEADKERYTRELAEFEAQHSTASA